MSRDVIMPALGMAQTTGLIVAWRKQPGDAVKAGDVLMEVETDKAVMEVAADVDGFLADVRAAAGEDVPVGDVIARIVESRTDSPAPRPAATPAPTPAPPAPVAAAPVEQPPPKPATAPAPQPSRGNGRIFASPRARRLAAEQGLDLSKLAAKGEAQPYLVKHLTTLRAPAPEPAHHAAMQGAGPALRLTASVTGNGFAEFCAWRRSEKGAPAEEIAVIAGMAAASYRPSAKDAPLVVSAEAFGKKRGFVDPDRIGLGAAQSSDSASEPSLIVRDLRGARVTDLFLGGEAAPVLTIMQRGPELFVTLECAPAHLRPEAAIALISEFAGRLAEPLRHLL